jgi:hypothetical protein
MAATPTSAVLLDLEAATERHPLDRKLLVCRTLGEGRELLRALAVHRGRPWLGWEITTPRRLALDLAGPATDGAGALADEFEQQAAVDAALDRALAEPRFRPLRRLGDGPGFRQAVLNAVDALRLAGVAASRLRDLPDSAGLANHLLAAVLDGYGEELAAADRVDTADLLERAARAITDGEDPGTEPDRIHLLPGLGLRGATGRLVSALLQRGATPVRADPVVGVDPPPVLWHPAPEPGPLGDLLADTAGGAAPELFAASGPSEEIREVLRRVMASGLRWDEVEIVALDPVVYGGALHAISERLGIPVSYAVGLPVERTRAGRAVAAYFHWIQAEFPADVVRRLLEAGDLRVPAGVTAGAVSRRLRDLRVGRGRDRYLPAIDRALSGLDGDPAPRRNETPSEARARMDRERRQLGALRQILAPILAATPPVGAGELASPAGIARGLTAFLARLAPGDAPSETARARMTTIARRVGATLTRTTTPAAAIAVLRGHLEIRVPAPRAEGSAPWTSNGGHLHLSDVEHGGHTGRKATFVVGLDSERFPGAGLQDPLLLDSQRRALRTDALPTSGERLAALRFRLAALLARLRGRVTLSYSAWDPALARELAPSSVVLQAFRRAVGRADASFEDLRRHLEPAASAVPRTTPLDAADVWIHALDHRGVLRDGTAAVRQAFPGLDRGMGAMEALAGDDPTAHHGAIRPRPDRLDPRRSPDLVLSASGLEDLGTCPRRYFYRYGLRIRPPDDPALDPDTWLDPLERGSLLHAVFEATLSAAREAGARAGDDRFAEIALDVLEREAERVERRLPPPGVVVRSREMADLKEDVLSFAEMMSGRDEAWTSLELAFGLHGRPTAELPLPGGTVRLRGAIDRVDRTRDGLVVIDYKTGRPERFERGGAFNGGRRLQNVVYPAVAERLLGARVHGMEYHFPTRRGRNETVRYERTVIQRGLALIDRLLDAVARGRFLPTEHPADCRFCDYAPICRHSHDGRVAVTPLADWGARRFADLPEYTELRDVRAWEESFFAELDDRGPKD